MNYYLDIFFRMLNFGALCIAIGYGFKKYALPALGIQLASKDAYEQALLSRQSVLESDHRDIDHRIDQDERLCADLHDKVLVWSSSIKKELHDRAEYKKALTAKLLTDQELQQECRIKQKLLADIACFATEQSRQDLIEKFQDRSKQKKFIQSILQFMQEHTS